MVVEFPLGKVASIASRTRLFFKHGNYATPPGGGGVVESFEIRVKCFNELVRNFVSQITLLQASSSSRLWLLPIPAQKFCILH